jgi:hypothetical protein
MNLVNVLQRLQNIQQGVAEGVMSDIDIDLQTIADSNDPEMLDKALNGEMGGATKAWLDNMFARVAQHRRLHPDDQQEEILEIMMDEIVSDYGNDKMESTMSTENLEECGMGSVGYQLPQQEPTDRYTLNIQRGDKNLNVTTDSPEELMMIMKLAGVNGVATVGQEVATEEFANTPDATKEREPRAYGDIRDWGFKGTGRGQPGSALNKPAGQGDNPLSEQAMLEEYRRFKQGK